MKHTLIAAAITILFALTGFTMNNADWEKISGGRVEVYFKFKAENRHSLNMISDIISIDNVQDEEVYAYANKREFEDFLELELEYTLLTPPGLSIENPRMLDIAGARETLEWDYYPTYEAYVDMMYQFQEDYPDICHISKITSLPSGRKILVAKITDNLMQHENEPEFLYTATMHGDETTGYVLMLRLIDYLLSNYGTDTRITNLVNNMEIWINPLANPDGTYAGGNSTVYGATRYNANGVDLNRNYPDPEDGPHPDGNEWQPETVAFMDFAEMRDFVMAANLHGGTEVCNYPWDTWYPRHADDDWWQFVCHEYADTAQEYSPYGYMTGYDDGITNGYDWYSISGGRQDYMNYFQQCREFTLEISNVKLLQANQLPDHWEYNYRSFLNYIEQTLYGLKGVITDSITGEPIEAMVYINGHDEDSSMVFSTLPVGNYHRPLYAGTYDITFSTAGYHSKTITNVSVFNYFSSLRNVKLVSETASADSSPVTATNVFPNPLTGRKLYIESTEEIGSVFLYNLNGRLIKVYDVESLKTELDVSELKSGTYFLKFDKKSNSIVRKLLIL